MTYRYFIVVLLAVLTQAGSAEAEPPLVAPGAMVILKNNCFACHNPEKKKDHLVLTSSELALLGDDKGKVIVAGKPDESRFITALAADADPHMPPKKQLDPQEIATLRAWVEAGAPWDDRALAPVAPTTRQVVLRALPASYHPVLTIALSPDEKQLAVGRRNRVYLHDLSQPNRPVTRVLEGPPDVVRSLAWSADGQMLATGGYRKVLVWSLQSQDAPISLENLEGRVTALCFRPDGKTLLTADGIPGGPGKIGLFQLPDSQPHASIVAHGDAIFTLQCTTDGAILASASADKLVKLWELPGLKEVAKIEGHTSHVLAASFNRDGTLLASAGADRDVKVWDVKTHEQKTSIGPHPSRINALAWPTTGNLIAVGDDGSLHLDSDTAKTPGPAAAPAEDSLYCVAATKDGKTVFAGCHDGKVYIWSGRKLLAALEETEPLTPR